MGIDPVAESVDGDVVMKPAQGGQVVGIMVAAVGSLADVVGLEPVAAVASLDRALVLVPPGDVSADRPGDGFSHVGICDGVESVGDDEADLAGAEDLGEGVGSDPRSGGDGGTGLSVGLGGEGGVDEHFGHGHGSSWFCSF